MSSAGVRLGLFAALLIAVFGAAALLGSSVGPHAATAEEKASHGDDGNDSGHGGEPAAATAGGLPGLAVASQGVRLVLERDVLPRSRQAQVRFRVVDEHGEAVRDFEVEHEKRMHLIVVRRDMSGFQHLHPVMAPDGTWSATADLSDGGTWRVFADFTRGGEQQTLGADVQVAGAFRPVALPAASTTARDDRGLEVRLRRDGARVAFDVLRDGEVVNAELEDYLGAKGHLVTLRAGDLAYLHTHPDGDELAFETELPTAGSYGLWVQFQLAGRVHTAAFTQEAPS